MKRNRQSFSPAAVRQRLVRTLKEIEVEDEEPDDLIAMEKVAEIIPTISAELTRAGLGDLYRESVTLAKRIEPIDGVAYSTVASVVETKAFLAKCIAALDGRQAAADRPKKGKSHATVGVPKLKPTTRKARPRNHIPPYTPPKHIEAYLQYKEAEQANGGGISDRRAYRWLSHKYEDLPSFETWARYVRGGRRATNDKKSYPRHGRPLGRSIVRASQI